MYVCLCIYVHWIILYVYICLIHVSINLAPRYGKSQWTIENLQIEFKVYTVLVYDTNVDWEFNQILLVSVYSLTKRFAMYYIYIRDRVCATVEFVFGEYQIYSWFFSDETKNCANAIIFVVHWWLIVHKLYRCFISPNIFTPHFPFNNI